MPTPAIPPQAAAGISAGRTGRPIASALSQNAPAVAVSITAPAAVGFAPASASRPTSVRPSPDSLAARTIQIE
jgi:hypothetical protein